MYVPIVVRFIVGDVRRPSAVTLGEANVNVEIDNVLADDHCVKNSFRPFDTSRGTRQKNVVRTTTYIITTDIIKVAEI